MRVVKEFIQEEIRVSVFSWNNKYILKYELGPMEQTFKISELDILEESDLESFWDGEFFEKVKLRFQEMGKSLRGQMEIL
ncbi:hypothetical protein [Algoriphagus machipongonensis]|uniref:Uncharacterized protein n=1 Tax=Algoriphagus machipongonensis TaxID=388413 RepID=A3HTS3_9BACT|nr:hypothetical protein [Algoriphagus machipongonensis]EAZ83241.1 hypothetical protein ALPR1_13510 [Algoriphagus machipongonensis]